MTNSQKINPKVAICLLGLVLISLLCAGELNLQKMQQLMQARFGDPGTAVLQQWKLMLDKAKQTEINTQLNTVNQFFNEQVLYAEDAFLYETNDYWATPLETMGKGAGDCEDYTIAKYITLLHLGFPVEKLRLIYVKAQINEFDKTQTQAHMVLGYYPEPNAIPLILDNLIDSLELATNRKDLHPVFSFNSEGLWVGTEARNDPTARLSRWRDLLARTQAEGF
jgi:predicted transglutaminase-like cysteine proteinase